MLFLWVSTDMEYHVDIGGGHVIKSFYRFRKLLIATVAN